MNPARSAYLMACANSDIADVCAGILAASGMPCEHAAERSRPKAGSPTAKPGRPNTIRTEEM